MNNTVQVLVAVVAVLILSTSCKRQIYDDIEMQRFARAENFTALDEIISNGTSIQRMSLVRALLRVDSKRAYERLLAIAKNDDAMARYYLLNNIYTLREPEAGAILEILSKDQSLEIASDASLRLQLLIEGNTKWRAENILSNPTLGPHIHR